MRKGVDNELKKWVELSTGCYKCKFKDYIEYLYSKRISGKWCRM